MSWNSAQSISNKEKEDGKWSIATFLRIRPAIKKQAASPLSVTYEVVNTPQPECASILFDIPPDADPGLVHNNSLSGKLKFEFDKVFDQNTTQEEIFDNVAKDKIMEAIDGINCTIFAYGQTGSGKTYSIFGGDSYKERGLIPRAVGQWKNGR